ncbi:hypothetical protein Aca07nite_54740 [Actinoplanes capillaceus]|uniref:DUF4132 domain-containing protein n=2 Tax=Actinoplanes campanulatus TaxID=113559 RepID=A0ABQ3WPL7_9ACTN|nr:hypothetical protein Aca07nite_54740 [Actinoplanes capillaceus]
MMASEDTLVLPDAWLEHLHPRRGGASTGLPAPEAVREATRWLAVSAAPACAAVNAATTEPGRAADTALADEWINKHGLRFAALAAVMTMVRSWRGLPVLLRVRAALVSAPEKEFEEVVAMLEAYRCAEPEVRAACSVLVPRPEWVEQDVADAYAAQDSGRSALLLYAAGTPRQAVLLARWLDIVHLNVDADLLITLVDGVGPGVAPVLFDWVGEKIWLYTAPGFEQRLLSVLAALPGDDVMRGLLARSGSRSARAVLLEAIERFPVRALRILAEEGDELLRSHVGRHPDLVDQVMPLLSPAAAGRVRAIVEAWGEVVTAPASAVPPVLADPPWRNREKAAKPPVVAGLTCADAPALSWLPGERQEWADTYVYYREEPDTDWLAVAESVINGVGRWDDAPSRLFARGPEEIARRTLPRWQPRTNYSTPWWLRVAVARFGTDALPTVLTLARATPADYGPLLMPFTSPEVATLMADWAARLKSVRRLAQRWLVRHPGAAARALIPAALGRAGTARRQAERALLLLHDHGHTEQIRAAADGCGPEAAAGVEALFVADPLMALPGRMPTPPEWAAPGVLPPVRLRDGSGALPVEAAANLILMLMISRTDDPYAGLELVRQAVEPTDLAEFGWALFELWQAAGGVAKDGWVYDAVALTGDDETARRLTPLIMAWPSEGRTAAAVSGLSVLVGIGTDEALMQVHRISQKAKSSPLREAAAARIAEVAEALGLSAEQLADRLIPDFGLDADGSLRLDYGPRQFVVGFDEQLRPFVADADGKRLKALPKPGARDDAELAEAAYRRFSALKRDVRKISAEQVKRLEQAMVTGRRWTGAEFRRLFAEHPLMWHIGRRLVWARFGDDGALLGALRIAEDRSLADVDDEPVELGDDDVVGIAHPVQLGADTSRWAEVFADYEIMQPFLQLGRPVYTLTEQEAATGRLERFEGVTVPTTKVIMLDRRGWSRQEAANAGIQPGFDRMAGPGQVLSVHLDPGIVGQVGYDAEQKLVAVYLHDGSASGWHLTEEETLPLSGLDPVHASEVLRDLTDVTT